MMTARESWSAVCKHADHLLVELVLPLNEATDSAVEDYEFGEEQVELLRDLFTRRVAATPPMILDDEELRRLTAGGTAGLHEARELLAAIGIVVP